MSSIKCIFVPKKNLSHLLVTSKKGHFSPIIYENIRKEITNVLWCILVKDAHNFKFLYVLFYVILFENHRNLKTKKQLNSHC